MILSCLANMFENIVIIAFTDLSIKGFHVVHILPQKRDKRIFFFSVFRCLFWIASHEAF